LIFLLDFFPLQLPSVQTLQLCEHFRFGIFWKATRTMTSSTFSFPYLRRHENSRKIP
jgi:hypothetical protein